MSEQQQATSPPPMTPEEAMAKQELDTAVGHWSQAVGQQITAAQGQIDIGGMFMQHNMVVVQMAMMFGILFELHPGLRERFYKAVAQEFRDAESRVRKATLSQPSIIHNAKKN